GERLIRNVFQAGLAIFGFQERVALGLAIVPSPVDAAVRVVIVDVVRVLRVIDAIVVGVARVRAVGLVAVILIVVFPIRIVVPARVILPAVLGPCRRTEARSRGDGQRGREQ